MIKLKFSKVCEVKDPKISTAGSAGIDFFVPKFTDQYIEKLMQKNSKEKFLISNIDGKKTIKLPSQSKILIPAGIKVNLEDPNLILIAFNKSGISAKRGLIVGSCVIDKDYQGQIHIQLINTSSKHAYIAQTQKIVQFLPFNFIDISIEQQNIEDLYQNVSGRGQGGFGSTYNK